MHRLPEQPGFWPRPLLQRRLRSERCSVAKNGNQQHQTPTPVTANVKTIPVGVLGCTCYLMKTRVLHVVRRSLLLSFYLHTNLKANGARHRWLVSSLFCETGNTYSGPLWWRKKPLRSTATRHPSCSADIIGTWKQKRKTVDLQMLREIRKEGLKNIQAHESYSDLRLREWEKHTQPISKLSNEILRGWEKKKKKNQPGQMTFWRQPPSIRNCTKEYEINIWPKAIYFKYMKPNYNYSRLPAQH